MNNNKQSSSSTTRFSSVSSLLLKKECIIQNIIIFIIINSIFLINFSNSNSNSNSDSSSISNSNNILFANGNNVIITNPHKELHGIGNLRQNLYKEFLQGRDDHEEDCERYDSRRRCNQSKYCFYCDNDITLFGEFYEEGCYPEYFSEACADV